MDPRAMEPHGAALLAYLDGDAGAQLLIRRDDGEEASLPASFFFREPEAFTAMEQAALARCCGRVLDVGAGTGLHSLHLQRQGLLVTAIDICPQAVEIMVARDVREARCADLFAFQGGQLDTVLILGHGIGMVESLAGLDRCLAHLRGLLAEGGQVLLDTLDVRRTTEPKHLAYQEANRRAGRYIGEIGIELEFKGRKGPRCGWLQVDPETLTEHAASSGWRCEVIVAEENGNYLARLTRAP